MPSCTLFRPVPPCLSGSSSVPPTSHFRSCFLARTLCSPLGFSNRGGVYVPPSSSSSLLLPPQLPQYIISDFNTFVCTACSGIHREFSHRVKSISLATFTEEEVAGVKAGGNEANNKLYMARCSIVPSRGGGGVGEVWFSRRARTSGRGCGTLMRDLRASGRKWGSGRRCSGLPRARRACGVRKPAPLSPPGSLRPFLIHTSR